jgi:hypothetical protein
MLSQCAGRERLAGRRVDGNGGWMSKIEAAAKPFALPNLASSSLAENPVSATKEY